VGGFRRGGWLAFGVSLGGAAASGCLDPTQLMVDVRTNALCSDVGSTAITAGNLGQIESSPPSSVTRDCNGGELGTLVVAPSGSKDDVVAFKVVMGIRKDAESCAAPDYKGCIVARRGLHYVKHMSLKVNVLMDLACEGIPCNETETCRAGACVPATIADPGACAGSGCDEGALDGGAGDARSNPASCAEANAAGQTVTLYVGHDPAKPWQAYCNGTTSYLPLPGGNVSSYPRGGCATVSTSQVVTTWSRVRIDPITFLVDTSDQTFAQSTGSTHEISGNGTYDHVYSTMPFAAARSCNDQPATSPLGTVDLRGSHFSIAPTQSWSKLGYSNNGGPFASEIFDATRQHVDLEIGGFPAGISPCNDYYTTTGGPCLQLVYGP
jgi:hypothetical protein